MSLDWDYGNCPKDVWRRKEFDESYYGWLKPVAYTLIWNCMSIGIGEITEKNWKEVAFRTHLLEGLRGNYLYERGPITNEEIKAHIGLHTNVFPKESRAKWLKRVEENWIHELNYAERQAEKERARSASGSYSQSYILS